MDFSVIFQLRTKRFWWLDVIFYFAISLLIATVFCYLIFIIKNGSQRREIKEQEVKLESVGTSEQKDQEKEVMSYQKKIIDFNKLFKSHEFASNIFVFMEKETLPNIWFKQFNMSEKNNQLQLSGEADNMESFSRQVAAFEKNEYVKSTDLLNSSLGEAARVQFNLNLSLNTKIFNYISENSGTSEETENTEGAENTENINNQPPQENEELIPGPAR